ncbi:collectin-46-like [Anaeramoeba flamelloides]|uniref:Collectin-46-like n=1 Tax=Anaeramoeba flamelloides TaxID=1746091 RepID=A0AAV7ZB86_9EUKA|nr:collectin-46-like [Anaeramoeba flamelloides]KAJ6253087.1 collectin-46-like [Anaeramoeba flamelloides]|eukprot:Anaeramoba_flamelloidesa1059015_141.p1 GENE.a1059015_141~~a1059015_141.p1  ORF type:complete len:320 (-),score=37.83 a1059015_141:153-1112(-)
MKNVVNLKSDLSSIRPTIDNTKIPLFSAEQYLEEDSCLGYYGPLGPYGPLGTLGPIGDNSWNPSYWISGFGSWTNWNTSSYGTLGPNGPLGINGPVSENQYYGEKNPGKKLFSTNDFARHSRGMGIFTSLGPIGPLGALSILGPLGPLGQLYQTNTNGEYLANGEVVRSVTVDFDGDGNKRNYRLFENYPEEYAKKMPNNDASFMVIGESSSFDDVDSYPFTSLSTQIVTILLVPEKQLDAFTLTISDTNGNVIAVSDLDTYINWVQIEIPAQTSLVAKVQCTYSGQMLTSSYRLIVTGSSEILSKTEITGDHISTWKN